MNPYPPNIRHTIPARSSVAVRLDPKQSISVINTHGTQVIDFWAFALPEAEASEASNKLLSTHLSMSHTRASTLHLSPLPSDVLVTNLRTPILQLTSDTTPGVHDTLIAACDRARYRQLGVADDEHHANCVDNLHAALARDTAYSLPMSAAQHGNGNGTATTIATAPDPLNLFMNIPVIPHGPDEARAANNVTAGADLRFESPVCDAGASVSFRALVDCLVVMSACPQDRVKVNNMAPTEAHFLVEG